MKRWQNKKSSLLDGYEVTNTSSLSSVTLKSCGLNKENNFLQAPICECGCGGKCDIILYKREDVLNFCEVICYENDCEYCGVFAITDENKMIFAIKCDDDIVGYECEYDNNPELIGKIFNDLELHCFGLIVYNGNDCYRIVEE